MLSFSSSTLSETSSIRTLPTPFQPRQSRRLGSRGSYRSYDLVGRGILPQQETQYLEERESNYHHATVRDVNNVRWWKPTTFLIQPYVALYDRHSATHFAKKSTKE